MAKPSNEVACFTKVFVRYPVVVMVLCFFVSVLLSFMSVSVGTFDLAFSWSDFESPFIQRSFALMKMSRLAGDLPDPSALNVTQEEEEEEEGTSRFDDMCGGETQMLFAGSNTLMFRSKSGNILTDANLASIREAVDKVVLFPGYEDYCLRMKADSVECAAPNSILQISPKPVGAWEDAMCASTFNNSFMGFCGDSDYCKISDEKVPSSELATLAELTPALTSLCQISALEASKTPNSLCKSFSDGIRQHSFPLGWDCDSLAASHTRVDFFAGYPLDGAVCAKYDDNKTAYQAVKKELEAHMFKMLNTFPKLKEEIETANPDLEVLYYGYMNILSMLMADITWAGVSILVVIIVLLVQTGSCIVTFAGIFEIIISIPMALFVWTVILGYEGVSNLMFIGVFVIIGIGADDIFVFVDAFKQSEYQQPEISGSLETRFEWAYKRSVSAMLATSITTTCAFLVGAFLPMWDMFNLAIFNAFMVMFDFALVCTWLPCSVVIHYKYLQPCWNKIRGRKKEENPKPPEKRCLEKCFGGPFANFVVKYNIVFSTIFVVWFLIALIVSFTMIELDGEDIRFFKEGHMVTESDKAKELFISANSDFKTTTMAFGPDTAHPWDLADSRRYRTMSGLNENVAWGNGLLVPATEFDLATNQEAFVTACETFHAELIARQLSNADRYYCFMEDFKEWAEWQGIGFPVPENSLVSLLLTWRSDKQEGLRNASDFERTHASRRFYSQQTGFTVDDDKRPTKVVTAWAGFNLTMRAGTFYSLKQEDDALTQLEEVFGIASQTAELESGFVWGTFFTFVWMRETLFKFAIESVIIAVSIAIGILLLMTGNWWVTIICALALVNVLCTSLMLMIVAGWKIGLNQACCLIVAAGMAVDYVVHIGHSFNQQKGTKQERAKLCLGEMGISVVSGAITSASSSIALVLCSFEIFYILGQFIIMMVTSSLIISVALMVPLLSLVGPNEGQGEMPCFNRKKNTQVVPASGGAGKTLP